MYFALALALLLPSMAIWLRLATGTWLHPAALFPMWWAFAARAPMIIAHDEPVSPGAVLWVIAASVTVSLSAIAGNGGLASHSTLRPPHASRIEQTLLGWLMLVSLLLGMASSLTFATASGVALSDLTNISKLVVVSNQVYVARVNDLGEAMAPPRLSQALLPFVYLAPVLGGMVLVLRREIRWKALALASLLPAISVTVLQTTKAAVLFSASLFLSSYFGTRLRVGNLKVFTKTHIVLSVALGFAAAAFFFATGLARMASTDTALSDIVRVKLVTAAFGHMSVFSTWLNQYWTQSFTPTLGSFTFAGPLEMLGLHQRAPGLFDNVVELVAGETSNIFTGFRPLIEDFSMPGALAILAILGATSGAAFRSVAAGNAGAVPVLIAAYMTILWTPITWFWVYNSLTATIVVIGLIILTIRLLRGTNRSAPSRVETSVVTT